MAGKNVIVSLVEAATRARRRAHAPYSKVKIGAAVLTSKGSIFGGANVENASYGLSMCAERTAVFNSVSAGGGLITDIAIVGESEAFSKPCGACRQVMMEFNPKMKVHRRGLDGYSADTTAEALLPEPFELKGPGRS